MAKVGQYVWDKLPSVKTATQKTADDKLQSASDQPPEEGPEKNLGLNKN